MIVVKSLNQKMKLSYQRTFPERARQQEMKMIGLSFSFSIHGSLQKRTQTHTRLYPTVIAKVRIDHGLN